MPSVASSTTFHVYKSCDFPFNVVFLGNEGLVLVSSCNVLVRLLYGIVEPLAVSTIRVPNGYMHVYATFVFHFRVDVRICIIPSSFLLGHFAIYITNLVG